MKLSALALLAVVAMPVRLLAQNQKLEMVRLSEGVYAAIYSEIRMDPVEGNSLIVISDDDVLVVDSGRTAASGQTLIGEIRKLTDKPVRYVVNSHWHDDHIFGNAAYLDAFPGVQFIAHVQTRDDMDKRVVPSLREYGVDYWTKMALNAEGRLEKGVTATGAPLTAEQKSHLEEQARTVREFLPKIPSLRVILPTVTFSDRLILHRGGREIQLLHLGRGNTQGDVVVYLPGEQILATGDLLVHPVPFAYGSSWPDWIDTLKALRGLKASVIVPGHGPVMRDNAYLDTVIELFESLMHQVTAAVKGGSNLEDTRKAVNLESFRVRLAGEDPVRKRIFADSILRSALQDAFAAATSRTSR